MKETEFSINGREISRSKSPYIIAEISANHNGSIQRAKDIVLAAKSAGVDAVKIQTYTPDTMTIDIESDDFLIKEGLWKERSLYELYSEAFTPFEWHEELFDFAKKSGITIFSSPFDETAVDLLESLNTPAYKIASFEIVDLPLFRYIAEKKKPMLISTGMSTEDEIGNAIEIAKSMGNNKIALFHCISSYPSPLPEMNLSAIIRLNTEFNVEVGLSDHTIGNLASIVATSLGASVIEKHFILDRTAGGVDSSFSIEPQEMTQLVRDTKDAHLALGSGRTLRSSLEDPNRVFRRSLYFVKEIQAGDKITKNHIRRIRPGYGLDPKYYDEVLGKTCRISASRGDRVTMKHFELG